MKISPGPVNLLKWLSVILAFTIHPYVLSGQTDCDLVYGLSPVLCNGRLYDFYPPAIVKGNQFLSDKEFSGGNQVTVRGKIFRNVVLNYDVFHQQLLLKYTTPDQAVRIIIIPKLFVGAFTLDHRKFVVVTETDSTRKFYQTIGSGSIYLYYFWRKSLDLESFTGKSNYIFSSPKREAYIVFSGSRLRYRNNKTFVMVFNADDRKKIKKYMHQHHLGVKSASDEEMEQLIYFCNKLKI